MLGNCKKIVLSVLVIVVLLIPVSAVAERDPLYVSTEKAFSGNDEIQFTTDDSISVINNGVLLDEGIIVQPTTENAEITTSDSLRFLNGVGGSGETPRPISGNFLVDGRELTAYQGFYELNGIVLGSIRTASQVGLSVNWREEPKDVTFRYGDSVLVFWMGYNSYYFNGEYGTLTVTPQIIDGYAYVPIKLVIEKFGGTFESVIYETDTVNPVSCKVIINGEEIFPYYGHFYEKNGVILGSIPTLGKAGFDYMGFDAKTKAITFELSGKRLVMWEGNSSYYFDGKYGTMPVPPQKIDGSGVNMQYLPMEFVIEIFGGTFEGKIKNTEPIDECFIATAAYGSKFTPAVELLRSFRDEMLLTNKAGQAFVEFYYKHSPLIAQFITDQPILKAMVRVMLIPAVAMAYGMFHPMLFVLLAFPISYLTYRVWRRNRSTGAVFR